jgi:carboxypeptidase Taq
MNYPASLSIPFGTTAGVAHSHFADVEIGRLLEQAGRETRGIPEDSDAASLLRVVRRRYERAIRVPAGLVSEIDAQAARTYQMWTIARPACDFAVVQTDFSRLLDLSRRHSDCFPDAAHMLDPLIAEQDEAVTTAEVQRLFAALRRGIVPLVRAIAKLPVPDDSCLRQDAPEAAQLAAAREAIAAFGYDLQRGRLDLTPHPFSVRIARDDVRLTTRVPEGAFTESLFIALHEAGHGLYEQGVAPELDGTPLAGAPSAGLDESQARLWENMIGRSRDFWEFFYPRLQRLFPDQLDRVDQEIFYRAVNLVRPSLRRGQADELTYNLHIMLRFDLEVALLEGRLAVTDLASAWAEAMEATLGVAVPNDGVGVLQDVHWYSGRIGGAFQSYTLGNIMAAQIYAAALDANPALLRQVRAGELRPLHRRLEQAVYRHGAKLTTDEMIRRVTGQDLSVEPYLSYLDEKYRALYGLHGTIV